MTNPIGKETHFPHFWADAGPAGLIIAVPSLAGELSKVMEGIRQGSITGYQRRWAAHNIEGIPFLFLGLAWGENSDHRFTIVFTPKHKDIVNALGSPRDILLVSSLPENNEEGFLDFTGPMATIHQVTLDDDLKDTFAGFCPEIH